MIFNYRPVLSYDNVSKATKSCVDYFCYLSKDLGSGNQYRKNQLSGALHLSVFIVLQIKPIETYRSWKFLEYTIRKVFLYRFC